TSDADQVMNQYASNHNVVIYRGSENDVLNRFIHCADFYNITKSIRVCADNPFLVPEYLDGIIAESEKNTFDYVSYFTPDGIPTIKTHFGLFAEYVSTDALKSINQQTS